MGTPNSIKLTRIRPSDYKNLPNLSLMYGTAPTKFGDCLAAFKDRILCYLTFYDGEPSLENLKKTWPKATLIDNQTKVSPMITNLFDETYKDDLEIYVRGTDFQVEVWEALLKIKKGATVSYEGIAVALGKPKAVRAAASAIANNNVAYFIPCHRVIKKNGLVHRYGCGAHRKVAMLRDEGAIN